MHDPFFHSYHYRKRECKKRLGIYKEELIQKVCTPSRMFNWNENDKYDFPDEYRKECEKWL